VHWQPGDVIVRREVWQGRPWLANPLYVVEDRADLLVLYQPEGSPFGFGDGDDWPTVSGRHPYDGRAGWVGEGPLGIHRPGDPFAVWAHWGRPDRPFLGWYVNIQVPFRRTPIGIDSLDLELDLLVSPELAVALKDEDHVDASAALGRFTTAEARAIHALGARIKQEIEEGGAWWDESWSSWTPPAEMLQAPPLRDGWADIPAGAWSDVLSAA
jgi:hypothetical protein